MEEEIQQSKFNTAISKEIRRAELWKDVINHSRSGKFTKWNEDLDCIWSELCADLIVRGGSKDKFNSKKIEFENFDEQLLEIGQIRDHQIGFTKKSKEDMERRAKHYKKLREKEVWLRLLENELGKGTEYQDEDEDTF